jgi:hypothetical protein
LDGRIHPEKWILVGIGFMKAGAKSSNESQGSKPQNPPLIFSDSPVAGFPNPISSLCVGFCWPYKVVPPRL